MCQYSVSVRSVCFPEQLGLFMGVIKAFPGCKTLDCVQLLEAANFLMVSEKLLCQIFAELLSDLISDQNNTIMAATYYSGQLFGFTEVQKLFLRCLPPVPHSYMQMGLKRTFHQFCDGIFDMEEHIPVELFPMPLKTPTGISH